MNCKSPPPPHTHTLLCTQGLGAIPPSAFYSPEHSHLSGKYIRFHFAKVSGGKINKSVVHNN